MEHYRLGLLYLLILLLTIKENTSSEDVTNVQSNPLANLILNQTETGDIKRNELHTEKALSRVKRQFYFDPDYRRRTLPPLFPIFFGGGYGFGGGGFGGRGFGGGYGGRGFGGGRGGGYGGGHGGGGFGGGHGGGGNGGGGHGGGGGRG